MIKKKEQSLWLGEGDSNFWSDSGNWDGNELPANIAMFSKSTKTLIKFSEKDMEQIDSIEFALDAPSYTFMFGNSDEIAQLTICGVGVLNNSLCTQSFVVAAEGKYYTYPHLKFSNQASAGGANNIYSAGPISLEDGYGGGIIGFNDEATAGSASFIVRTGALTPPPKHSIGGEVAFCDKSLAGTANFTIYGSLGLDGDTFGNVVFHDSSSADHGMFTNIGGTVSGGDGGNTQLFNYATAGHASFYNFGGTVAKANGGDVAFDGNADGGYATFHNVQAKAKNAFGGVTSFNNNPPSMDSLGASAGNAIIHNYGAKEATDGGGGHTEFTARYGSSTGANATFFNHGSAISGASSAGHTIFSITFPSNYTPSAGNGTYWNLPALSEDGVGGYTSFAIYGDVSKASCAPTAENGTLLNLGANHHGVYGGYTTFLGNASAGNAQLIAFGGTNGGNGGQIFFNDNSIGSMATIELNGNGELDISGHKGELSIGSLNLNEGIVKIKLGRYITCLKVKGKITLASKQTQFFFVIDDTVEYNHSYTIASAMNMKDCNEAQFTGNCFNGIKPRFYFEDYSLKVIFDKN